MQHAARRLARGSRLALRSIACVAALTPLGAAAAVVHFVNGDRLSGTLVAAPDGFVAIDVAHVGVVTVPQAQIARTDAEIARTDAENVATAGERVAVAPAVDWDTQADLALVVASGNTRTEDVNLVVGTKRTSARFDNVLGAAVRKSAARAESGGYTVDTKDQFDIDYDLRWKYRESWYAVGNVNYFRDAIKNIDQRMTAGAGIGHTFWESARGALRTDAGISQVFERVGADRGGPERTRHNPALRWGLRFNRWLVADRLELFHNNELLRILADQGGAVWDSDTGIRLHVNSHWQAGLRIDVEHETAPAADRGRTDASYALALGVRL